MRKFNKIFCIGKSRTGTSSLAEALCMINIPTIHNAAPLTMLAENNIKSKMPPLAGVSHMRGFGDHPIDWMYKGLDKEYPNSLFILTIRKDRKKWLRSMHILNTASAESHDEKKLIKDYDDHLEDVYSYFKYRPKDLLILDITEGNGWKELCEFLEVEPPDVPFPHVGKSKGSKMEKKAKKQGWIK